MSPVPPCLYVLAQVPVPDAKSALADPVTMVALGIGAVMLIYLIVLRPGARKANRGRKDPLATLPSQRSSLASERAAERQMQSLLVELEQMARKMHAQLDTKAAKLEALIAEAEEKTAALTSAVARAKADGIEKRDTGPALAGRLADLIQAGKTNEPVESGLAALARHREIYDMADNGTPANVIAQRLRRPCGEVELILALRGPKEKKAPVVAEIS